MVIPQIECPNCLSHHRHRLFQLLAERRDFPFFQPGSRILHGAPEWHVRKILESRAGLWVLSTDIEVDQVKNGIAPWLLCDLTQMPISDNCFDAVFLFHVLEHIPDDRLALSEIFRLLKPGGTAVIMVPVNPALSATEEWGEPRKDLYDHVRDYSSVDFPDRLSAFEVEAVTIRELAPPEEQWRYMIYDHEIVYLCRKPAS